MHENWKHGSEYNAGYVATIRCDNDLKLNCLIRILLARISTNHTRTGIYYMFFYISELAQGNAGADFVEIHGWHHVRGMDGEFSR